MNANVQLDRDALAVFCHKWRIRELSVFGSALRDDFGPESDLDFLVSFDPEAKWDLFDLLEMKTELEALYGRTVDLVEREALRNPWRKRDILKTREVTYAPSRQQHGALVGYPGRGSCHLEVHLDTRLKRSKTNEIAQDRSGKTP